MDSAASQSEKAEVGAQPTPPQAGSSNPDAAGAFAHAEQPSSSSLPLLQKLRVDRKWRAKWKSKKRAQQPQADEESGQEAEEGEDDVEAVEEGDEGTSMLGRASRSSNSYYISTGSRNSSRSSVRDKSSRNPALARIWRFLGVRFFAVRRIGYHHVLMGISVVGIILLSLLVAGCSSHRMRGIYLLHLSYDHQVADSTLDSGGAVTNPSFYSVVANTSSTASLAARVGYFGVCMAEGDPSSWTCRPKAKDLAKQVLESQDPLNVLAVADNFRDQVIVSVIIIMAIIMMLVGFCGLGTFPGWHEETRDDEVVEVKPFPSRAVSILILGLYVLATLFLLTAILWQHVAVVAHSATIEAAFNGAVKGEVGTAAMAFGWVAIGVNCIVIIGLGVMVISLAMLRDLLDDDEVDA